ncbi:unnamed protein product [Chrysoparadoxa australica]
MHGTTTVSMIFQGGAIVAVDSRASMGSVVGSRTTMKVIPVSETLLGTMAGGAADCIFWLRYLSTQVALHEQQSGSKVSVKAAARMLANTLHRQKGAGLSVGTMIVGEDQVREIPDNVAVEVGGRDAVDEACPHLAPALTGLSPQTGPSIYYVDSDGARLGGKYFSVGSGSTYAYGILDTAYRYDMSLEEAARLARRAVERAAHRDAYSGGYVNVFHVSRSGWKQLSRSLAADG